MSTDPTARNQDGQPGITLVLGGGGARGLAHFGVLRVLEQEQVPIRAVVGSSAGALAAAVYLQCGSAERAVARTLAFLGGPRFQRHKLALKLPRKENGTPPPSMVSRLLSGWRRQVAMHLLFRRPALFHSRRLEGVIVGLVEAQPLAAFPRPLAVVALDLETGEEVVLEDGPVRAALLAACSVAGFFPPVAVGERLLIDAGQADNLPVQVGLRFGRPVVAVNLSAEVERRRDFPTGIEVLFRSEEIGSRWNSRLRLRDADVLVTPRLQGRYWLDFSDLPAVVRAGEDATRAALPDLRAALQRQARSAAPPVRSSA